MSIFYRLNPLLLSFTLLFASPLMQAASLDIKDTIRFNKNDCVKHSHDHKSEEKIPPLTLADFAGRWVVSIETIGGVDGGEGVSSFFDGEVIFNTKGKATLNYGSLATYSGTPGEISTKSIASNTTKAIQILDKKNGIGILTLNGLETSIDFIAIRDIKTGKVVEMRGHSIIVEPAPQPGSVRKISIVRQFI